jgi:hypothetical protein
VIGIKTGRDSGSDRQTDTLTLRDRLRNVRRRKQAHHRLAARLDALQPLIGEQQEKRDD